MIFLFVSLILLASLMVFLLFKEPSLDTGMTRLGSKTLFQEFLIFEEQLNSYVKEKFPVLFQVFQKAIIVKLLLPSLGIFCLFALFINPKITNANFALILAILMTITYALRIFYHNLESFRSTFLSQLKQLFFNIRNQLSTGISLDQALIQSLGLRYKDPLKKEFKSFMNLSQTNLIENFPNWLLKIQAIYKLKGLDKVAQILKLELKYNNNQEEAFEKAIESISQRVEQNTRQKNTVFISLTTIDFLTLMFFGVLFFVIPGLNIEESTWWISFRRELVVFSSALILWLLYFASVLFLIKRVA